MRKFFAGYNLQFLLEGFEVKLHNPWTHFEDYQYLAYLDTLAGAKFGSF